MKILVTGDREWTSLEKIASVLEDALTEFHIQPQDVILIHGAARGADSIAGLIGEELGMDVRSYPAKWDKYGRAAGPIRNKEMLDDNPDIDLALAFHPDLSKSKGTRDMIGRLIKAGIEHRHCK